MTTTGIPWNKFGLICELATRLGETTTPFGKTKLQKLVFLMQEAFHLDCGYAFSLYTYGPFCSELMEDLDSTEAAGGVVIKPSSPGYSISPGDQAPLIKDKAKDFLSAAATSEALDRLIGTFGSFSARELELRSTILFVCKDNQPSPGREKVLDIVHEIKPKFSMDDIRSAAEELASKGFLHC